MPDSSVNNPVPTALFGLVLAGGKSSRMGHDKSLITYHHKPQREYLFEMMHKSCAQVFISCKSAADVPAALHPLPDQFKIESPLNGILSAFKLHPSVAWLTVPVDMPFVDEHVIRYLIEHRNEKKVATCFYDSDGEKPEPLLTLWEPVAFPELISFYNEGNFSARKFLMQHDIHLLKAPDERIYQNINSPEEFVKFQSLWKNQSP